MIRSPGEVGITSVIREEFWRLFGSARAWSVLAGGLPLAVIGWVVPAPLYGVLQTRVGALLVAVVLSASVAAAGALVAGPETSPPRQVGRVAAIAALTLMFGLLLAPMVLGSADAVIEEGVLLGAALSWALIALPLIGIAATSGWARRPALALTWAAACVALPWLAGGLSTLLPGGAADLLRLATIPGRLHRVWGGVVDVGDVAWFVAWGSVACALAVVARRWALLLVPLVPFALGPALGTDWPVRDLLVFEDPGLQADTRAGLARLRGDVTLRVRPTWATRQGDRARRVRDLLFELDRASPRVRVVGARDVPVGVVEVTSAAGVRVVVPVDTLFVDEPYTHFTGEYELTRAIRGVDRPVRRVGLVVGHGEAGVADVPELVRLLEGDAHTVVDVDLLAGDAPVVPADLDVLLVLSPRTAWSPVEDEALARYLGRGGAVLAELGPATFVPDAIDALGVQRLDGVVDPDTSVALFTHPMTWRVSLVAADPVVDRVSAPLVTPGTSVVGASSGQLLAALTGPAEGPGNPEWRLVVTGIGGLGAAPLPARSLRGMLVVDAVRWLLGDLVGLQPPSTPRVYDVPSPTLTLFLSMLTLAGGLSSLFVGIAVWVAIRERVTPSP